MIHKVQTTYVPTLKDSEIKTHNNTNNNVFSDVYNAAIDLIEETNKVELEADQKSLEFAMGKTSSIEDVLIAQEKANLLLQFTIQVRNKAIESYKEIMRMPL